MPPVDCEVGALPWYIGSTEGGTPMTSMTWSIQGPHFVNCNCDYGCPCQFWGRPTDGTCRAVLAWRIEEGHWGDVRLDGLCAINTEAGPGAIHEGNGSMQSIIDERASKPQRQALVAILQGEGADPGPIISQLYRPTRVTLHEPLFKPIHLEVDVDARTASLRVPGVLDTRLEPIRNKVTGALHRARIALPFGK